MADIFDQVATQPSAQPAQPAAPQSAAPTGDIFDKVAAAPLGTSQPSGQPAGFLSTVGSDFGSMVKGLATLPGRTVGYLAANDKSNDQQLEENAELHKKLTYEQFKTDFHAGQYGRAFRGLLNLLDPHTDDPNDPLSQQMTAQWDASKQAKDSMLEAAKKGDAAGVIQHAAGVLPVANQVDAAMSNYQQNPTRENLAHVVTAAVPAFVPSLVKGLKKLASPAVEAVAETVRPTTEVLPGGEEMPVRSQSTVGKLAEKLTPTETIEGMDRTVQNPAGRRGVANLANEVADTGETVKTTPPTEDPLGIRQASEALKARSKATWNTLDDLSNGEFSQAQLDASDAADDFTSAGKKAYREALAKQDAIFDKYADQLPEGTDLQKARTEYRQYNGMQKLAKRFDSAWEPTPGQTDEGYVDPGRLRAKIGDAQQAGEFKQAGFSGTHVRNLDRIATLMEQAASRSKISKVAMGVAADIGYHTLGWKVVSAATGAKYITGKLFGALVTNPTAAGTFLKGMDSGQSLMSVSKQVSAVLSSQNRIAQPSMTTVLAGQAQ